MSILSIFCAGIIAVSALVLPPAASAQEIPGLEQILDRAYQTEEVSQNLIKDYVCQSTFIMREPQKDGSSKTILIEEKTVYFRPPDQERETFRSVNKNGKDLPPDKLAEYQQKADQQARKKGSDDGGNSGSFSMSAKSPWSPEERSHYNFQLLPPDTVRGIPAVVLEISPLEENEQLIDGQVWFHQDLFQVLKMDFQPAKNPRFVKKVHMILDFDEVLPGFWLPVELKIDAAGGILFIKKAFQMHQTWRDYEINVALPDSLFLLQE
jgi:hypothetical protein